MYLQRPPFFCEVDPLTRQPRERYDEWTPGSITLGLVGHGYWVIPPGSSVDLDSSIAVSVVKSNAPHLVTQDEWDAIQALKKPHKAKADAAKQ